MSASSSLKGKGRAPAPDVDPRPGQSAPPPVRSKPAFRHGRGPIIPDDDEESASGVIVVNREGEGDDERTHLLYAAGPGGELEPVGPGTPRRGPSWRAWVVVFLLAGGFVVLLLVALVHLWVGHVVSDQGRRGGLEEMARRGITLEGPFQVGLREGQAENEVIVLVNLTAGVDARRGLGWEDKETHQASILNEWEAYWARLAVRATDSVEVTLTALELSTAHANGSESTLLVVPALASVRVPVSYPRGAEPARTTPLGLSVPLRFPDADAAGRFAYAVWDSKKYAVRVRAKQVEVRAGKPGQGGVSGWALRRFGDRNLGTVEQKVKGTLPALPGTSDPSSLVKLISYSIKPSTSHSAISLSAEAHLTSPITSGPFANFAWEVPFRLPFTISIPVPTAFREADSKSADTPSDNTAPPPPHVPLTDVLLAKVSVEPFGFAHGQHKATLRLEGELVRAGGGARGDDGGDQLKLALSRFAARYMAGQANTVLVRYDDHPDPVPGRNDTAGVPPAPFPPPFVARLARGATVPLSFPGSAGGGQDVFKNLRIEDMKIKLNSAVRFAKQAAGLAGAGGGLDEPDEPEGDLLCSGRVVGELSLPVQFLELSEAVDVTAILPDVLVYDGDLPKQAEDDPAPDAADNGLAALRHPDQLAFIPAAAFPRADTANPLHLPASEADRAPAYPPSPIPRTAFARLHPAARIPAKTTHVPGNATAPARTFVSATFTDTPLFILDDRMGVFQHFVGQILFGREARAGVRGVSGADLGLGGWGEVRLEGLPLEAEFNVGGM